MHFPRLLPLLLLLACSAGTGRQEIDLSDRVTDQPQDGIGHYVYALALPESIKPGETLEIQMDWRTVGPTDGRNRYAMDVLLEGPDDRLVFPVDEYANTVGEINLVNWLNYYFPLPETLGSGRYTVGVRLRSGEAAVPLGFEAEMEVDDGFYAVGTILIDEN